jgi:hypothetical protein
MPNKDLDKFASGQDTDAAFAALDCPVVQVSLVNSTSDMDTIYAVIYANALHKPIAKCILSKTDIQGRVRHLLGCARVQIKGDEAP